LHDDLPAIPDAKRFAVTPDIPTTMNMAAKAAGRVEVISLQEIVRPDHRAPHMRRVRPVKPQPLLGLLKMTSDDVSPR
jgi:hypothetical protein